jgi:hypothetical protein
LNRALRWICLLTAALVATTAVAATNLKAYHGAFCLPDTSGATITATKVTYDRFGARCSTGTCRVLCPLIRDIVGDVDTLENVVVEIYNANSTALSCQIARQGEDTGGFAIDTQTKSTTTVGDTQLVFDAFDKMSSGREGSMSLSCNMEASDRVYHVHVDENTTDGGTE